ncbi:hypothetical protein SAMN06295967_103248 [Belliella buryatensis]|uniref:Uncharacterized protein n=1 Tax=Belliella buryatensis TaxID=1500549 RepID=A0A239BUF9_9BACT|nr:hypothetical protein SAMN06295967_103248 [Belliella buryatensis]
MVYISLKKELNEKRSIEKGIEEADNGILKPQSEAKKIYENCL